MKRILITGANSYIGTSFEEWVSKYPDLYQVDSISLRDDDWRVKTFKGYDVVLHTVGIAHVDSNPNPKMESLYYRINRDLTIETARKAKEDGVKQFIFMSSIIVYGESRINEKKIIYRDTVPRPTNFYGNSKLQAEKGIRTLENDNFRVVIIRSPMIYGKGSKGNYHKLSKLSKITPVFPSIRNERSMIHIDNLCEFIKLIIDNKERGIFYPQNEEYVETSELVKLIAEINGRKIWLTNLFNPLLIALGKKIPTINKVFGNLVYDQKISEYKNKYRVRNFKESIKLTEI